MRGRQKGVPNKLTQAGRHAIFEVFDKIGGVDKFAEWAGENLNEYYKLWGKTIPQHTQLTGMNGDSIKVESPLSDHDKEILALHNQKIINDYLKRGK